MQISIEQSLTIKTHTCIFRQSHLVDVFFVLISVLQLAGPYAGRFELLGRMVTV